MKLYYAPGVCSLSPHIALKELGIDAELIRVNTNTHTLEDGSDYLAINPHGYVPLLELDDGQRMAEGPAIVQYLADLRPEAALAPPNGTLPRYRLQELLAFINSELHKAMAPLFDAATPAELKAALRTKIGKRLDRMAEQLQGKSYLMGEQFTVADGYLFTVLGWMVFVNIDLVRWPVLKAYEARVADRPSVREAMRYEGLVKQAD